MLNLLIGFFVGVCSVGLLLIFREMHGWDNVPPPAY